MAWFNDIKSFLEAIPATFWGVIFGSFFSLAGVMISNRSNDRRLREQFSHDREQKNRERELTLKKEIFLSVAEAFSAGIGAVNRFGNLEISNEQITSSFTDKSSSVAKVYVIAKMETSSAVAKFTSELASTYLRLFAKRVPLIEKKQRIDFLKEQIAAFSKQRDQMLELMREYNINGETNPEKFEALNSNFQFEQQNISNTIKEQDQALLTLHSQQLDFIRECVSETVRLNTFLTPALIAIRTELELPIAPDAFDQLFKENSQKMEQALSEFVQQIQQNISERVTAQPERD
jgi:hypothetical protein